MTTANNDSVTNDETDQVEELGDAEAESLFAEAADALDPSKSADKEDKLDEGAAAPKPDDDKVEVTAGEGKQAEVPEGQTGGGEGEAAVAAAEPGEGDLWVDADPKLKAAFEAAEEARKRAEQQFRSRDGRERALQLRIDELSRGGKSEEAEPRKPLKELLETDQIKALGEEYPDFVPLIDALREAGDRADGALDLAGKVKTDVVARASSIEQTKLTQALPDWQELAGHEKFQAWVDDQPKKVRDTIADNWDAITNAEAVKGVFETFRDTVVAPKEPDPKPEADAGGKRQRQAEGTKVAKVTSPAAASGESDDPEVLFKQAAAKVDRERGHR